MGTKLELQPRPVHPVKNTIELGACLNTAAAVSPKNNFSPGRRLTPMMSRSQAERFACARMA